MVDDNKAQVEHMTVTTQKTQGIVITPTILLVAIFSLFQIALGIGMWSISEKMEQYDGYESRISDVEDAIIRMEDMPEQLDELTNKFDKFAEKPRFSADEGDDLAEAITKVADAVVEMKSKIVALELVDNSIKEDVSTFKQDMSAEQTRQWNRLNDMKSAIILLNRDKSVPVDLLDGGSER